jgi:anti-sigma factor RsiW
MARKQFDNACTSFEARLEDYLSGALPAAEHEDVSAHLASCAACSESLKLARMAGELLRESSQPPVEASPFFARRVMTAIRNERETETSRAGFWRPLESLSVRVAWSASAALVLLLAYGAVSGVPSMPTVAEMRPAEPAALFPDPVSQTVNPEDVLAYAGGASNGK